MKIATYNVRVDTEYDQDWQWFFRKEAVCQLINFMIEPLLYSRSTTESSQGFKGVYNIHLSFCGKRRDGQGEGLAILYNEQKVKAIDTGYFGYLKHLSSQVSILKLAVQELLCGDYLRKRLKIRLFSHQCSFGSYFSSCSFSRNDRYLRGVT